MPLHVGDKAPDAEFCDTSGGIVHLHSLLGRPLVLFFYPADFTPGCTAEACSFRDAYQDFLEAGADVIGVSGDDGETHDRFRLEHQLPFRLLSDPDGGARKAFRVGRTMGLVPGRVTFVIDADGIVRHTFASQVQATRHVQEALAVLRGLS